jgi:hypothetical protein
LIDLTKTLLPGVMTAPGDKELAAKAAAVAVEAPLIMS